MTDVQKRIEAYNKASFSRQRSAWEALRGAGTRRGAGDFGTDVIQYLSISLSHRLASKETQEVPQESATRYEYEYI
jgi:hypothetical protein